MTAHSGSAALAPDVADRLQRVVARIGRVLRQAGGDALTLSQMSMLGTIAKHDGCRIGELAVHESIGAPVATRVVASLETLALVRREPDCLDGRASLVHITAKGTRALGALRRQRAAVLLARLEGLDAVQAEALARALPTLERLAGD